MTKVITLLFQCLLYISANIHSSIIFIMEILICGAIVAPGDKCTGIPGNFGV